MLRDIFFGRGFNFGQIKATIWQNWIAVFIDLYLYFFYQVEAKPIKVIALTFGGHCWRRAGFFQPPLLGSFSQIGHIA